MPNLTLGLPETYDSITRPVITGVIRDLIDYFELPNDTRIKYQGTAGASARTGSELARRNPTSGFPFSAQVKVDIQEKYIEEGILSTPINRFDVPYFFEDTALGVYLKPVYYPTEAKISFIYRAESKTAAYAFRDTLYRRSIEQFNTLFHELTYHIPVPDVMSAILAEIHRLRENQHGYGDSLGHWLGQHYISTVTNLTNLAGCHNQVAIAEKQIQVLGYASYITTPDDLEKKEEGETWTVQFDYTFQYSKPALATMVYPVIVHNQLLSSRYVDKEPANYNPYDRIRRRSLSVFLNDQFSGLNQSLSPKRNQVVLPAHDDWQPGVVDQKYSALFTALVRVEDNDPRQVINLTDLSVIRLGQPLLNFLYRHRADITTPTASGFLIRVYKGKNPIDSSLITITEDLNVKTQVDLNPRNVHHIQLLIVAQPKFLSRKALDALRYDPEVCAQYIDLLDSQQASKLNLANRSGAHSYADNFTDTVDDWNLKIAYAAHRKMRENQFDVSEDTLCNALGAYTSFSEAVSDGLMTLATKNVDASYEQPIIALFKGGLYYLIVKHNLKGKIGHVKLITTQDFEDYIQNGFIRVSGNQAVGQVITQTGQIVPTLANSKARRVTSPTRPNINALLVSDELKILGGKVVTKESLEFALAHFRDRQGYKGFGTAGLLRTVMQAGIITQSG